MNDATASVRAPSASRREFLVGGALLASALASGALARAVGASGPAGTLRAEDVPQRFAEWRFSPSNTLLIPEGEGAGDPVYDQVVARHYVSDTDLPVMLLIAYGGAQSGSTQLHRPELCYPAAGFRMIDHPDVLLRLPGAPPIPARTLTGTAPGRTEQIVYWSRVGADFPTRSLAQRWSVLRQTIAHGAPDGALVRFSAITEDQDAGLAALRRFAAALLAASGPNLRQLLVGAA
ncbi:EpsI family protein [Sphingomonas sp. BN140010]|uniref:EpsI family protein n=1 Tax=Sphingomonas arvum TaxID=2992113 RepID=A0ABT3JBX0_9SPHN|nr:exosortase C-terminal domain/associated protein EpsI [Sphingomonas sp. BN140010]MCW3796563.1 EpsI family protein [Sphingomonas sp. BN140010]